MSWRWRTQQRRQQRVPSMLLLLLSLSLPLPSSHLAPPQLLLSAARSRRKQRLLVAAGRERNGFVLSLSSARHRHLDQDRRRHGQRFRQEIRERRHSVAGPCVCLDSVVADFCENGVYHDQARTVEPR